MTKSGIEVFYHPLVVKRDIPAIDKSTSRRIKSAIQGKLMTRPEVYGLPLRGTLKKLWKLRVGDYRIIYEIGKQKVYILLIAHRKEVYFEADKRRNG